MTTRLLLVGDLHIHEGEQLDDIENALAFVAQTAAEGTVDAVLLAGDAFDHPKSTAPERNAFADFLVALRPLPITIIYGNATHDGRGELDVFRGYPDVEVFETPDLVTIHDRVDVLCVPWPEKAYLAANGHAGAEGDQAGSAALRAMLRGMVATREHPDRPLVILGHLSVLGAITSSAQPMVGQGIQAVLGDLQDLGASFVALGHVHKPQQLAPGVEYIGSLTVHDFGEEDEEKRIGILTVEDDGAASVEWIPVPCRRWVTVEAAVRASTVCETPSEAWEGGADGWAVDGMNVRYRYTCTEEEQALFDHAAITRRFAAAHTLKIVPQVTRAERVRAAQVAAAKSSEEKLQAWGTATGTAIPSTAVEKLHTLESEVTP